MLTEDINIKSILFNEFHNLGNLCRQSKQYYLINEAINKIISNLNPGIANYCRITNVANNYLYIETSRSEYLTQLRFITSDILSELRQIKGLQQIIGIKFKINPTLEEIPKQNKLKTSTTTQSNMPSGAAAINLANIAKNIKNTSLKAALLKLSKTKTTED